MQYIWSIYHGMAKMFWSLMCTILQDIGLIIGLITLLEQPLAVIQDGLLYAMIKHSYLIFMQQQIIFVILVVCLIRIPSLSLAALSEEIRLKKSASITDMVSLYLKWKKQYQLVCELVGDVNNFIGIPIFLFIIFSFIYLVSILFFLLYMLFINDLNYSDMGIQIYTLFKYLFCLIALAFASENMLCEVSCQSQVLRPTPFRSFVSSKETLSIQVSKVSKQLRHLHVPVYAIQNQVITSKSNSEHRHTALKSMIVIFGKRSTFWISIWP